MSIKSLDIKILYALSAGKCNICNVDIIDGNIQIGEMAHIIARSPDGPRGDIDRSININGHQNLILLCPNHHTEVDKNPDSYPAEELLRIKNNHERNIRNLLGATDKFRKSDSEVLDILFSYIPITDYISQVNNLPQYIYIHLPDPVEMYECFFIGNPQCYPFYDSVLHDKFKGFLRHYEALGDWLSGCLCDNRLIPFYDNIRYSDNFFEYKPSVNPYTPSYNHDAPMMVLNKRYLTNEQNEITCSRISSIKHSITISCYDLIYYVRTNYPEVSFR